jgi:uncharacterized delta-60 repeat protein
MRLDGTTGAPDAAFDTDGILITDFGGSQSLTGATAVFVDETASKIIAAGTGNDNFAVARYAKADGTLDAGFGVGGMAEADVPHAVQSSESARAVAVQPDGKVVVVGPTNVDSITQFGGDEQFGLARYNPDGSLDAGFGVGGIDGNGRVSTNFDTLPSGAGTADSPAAVALQSDGKIVVAGGTDPASPDKGDVAVARYEPDGDLDPTFGGGDGLVTTDFAGAEGDSGTGVAIEGTPGSPGFRIVVSGTKNVTSASTVVAVAVYDENGTPDATFDGDGKQTTNLVSVYPTGGVAIQPDGSVLVAGTKGDFDPFPVDFALIRYDANGALDSTFGGGTGIVTTDFVGGHDEGHVVAVEDLGAGQVRIVVGGRADADTSFTDDGGLAVYTTDGTLDPSFAPGGPDGDGKLTFDLAGDLEALRGVALQSDGTIVGVGSIEAPNFGAARVTSTGSLDSTFGGDGLVSTAFPNPNFEQRSAFGVALQPDDKVVAVGGAFNPNAGSDFLVARYLSHGTAVPPSTTPPTQPPASTPSKKKKCKKKKKHRAASAKKCKKKKKK